MDKDHIKNIVRNAKKGKALAEETMDLRYIDIFIHIIDEAERALNGKESS